MAARQKRLHLAAFCICVLFRILINASSTGRVLKIARRVNSWSNHGRNRSEILLGRHHTRTCRLCRISRIDVHFWQPISTSPELTGFETARFSFGNRAVFVSATHMSQLRKPLTLFCGDLSRLWI
jgi:hypothetical protein